MVREKGIPEVLGININGDLEDKEIVRIAKKCKDFPIWIGDNPLFKDPFYVANLIADYVSFIGFGVVTIERGCKKILNEFKTLVDEYRDTVFALGIGAGSLRGYEGLKAILNCLKLLRDDVKILLCGCSGPLITSKSSKIVDGILFNYGHPDHLKWIYHYLRRDVHRIAYAPSLILPSDFEKDLLIACAIVSCSSESFAKSFGYESMFQELSKLDFSEVIVKRKEENIIPKVIEKYREILIEKFAIAGKFERFVERVKVLLKICDHVVLGDPFFRDKRSLKLVRRVLRLINEDSEDMNGLISSR